MFLGTGLLLSGAFRAAEHSRNSDSRAAQEGSRIILPWLRDLYPAGSRPPALLFSPALPPESDAADNRYRKSCLEMAAVASPTCLALLDVANISKLKPFKINTKYSFAVTKFSYIQTYLNYTKHQMPVCWKAQKRNLSSAFRLMHVATPVTPRARNG